MSLQTATVTPAELRGALDGARLLDVRTPGEYAAGRIPGSVNVPLPDLAPHAEAIAKRGGELVVVCQSGARAGQAADILRAAGHPKALVLAGGLHAWQCADGAVDSDAPSAWTIERQVRLVAGSIVLSSILASLKAPKARFVAGAIGGGLTFAALSNTCLMGTLLAKLPHNRGPAADVEAAVAALTA
jgi:rhodanese-related sulfurtransferase